MRGLRLLPLVALVLAVPAAAVSPAGQARVAADCSVRATGLTALPDLGRLRYHGHPGGLYPGSANRPPRRHLDRGVAAASRVRPIRGRIGFLGVGLANTIQEFRGFAKVAAQDPLVNRSIVFVEGNGPGWDARRMSRPGSRYWTQLDVRLRKARLARTQVQVVWLKQAIAGEERPFPQSARALQAQLRAIVRMLAQRFPNLQLVYVSSRTYGGYAITHVNPEPFAYETGFAAKWLVQDAIAGKVRRVWAGWGPYLWTDGLRGRRDGLVWACEDVQQDGMHPSAAGVRKVARQLHEFFSADTTARPWFLAPR